MSSPKKFKRGWMILLLVIVAALLVPWGWSIYKESRPKEVRIREAIEGLVVSPSNPPELLLKWKRFLTRIRGSFKRVGWDAVEKLQSFGIDAFPYLIEHFDDERPGPAMGSYSRQTVGLACYLIIEWQLFDWSNDYPFGRLRRGSDGSIHPRPGSNDLSLFGDDFKAWLLARKDRSLAELQLEAQEWALAQEQKIGISDPGDEEANIAPLRRRVSKLRAAVEAERKR